MNLLPIQRWALRALMVVFWICIMSVMLIIIPRIRLYLRPANMVTILALPNTLNGDMFQAFTQKTGIPVALNYAENADEIMMKIRATQGHGYDLIMMPDYKIPELIKAKMVQELQHEKLTFLHDLYPALCDHAFDPQNRYSIPYYWGIYGFGVDQDYFDGKKRFSWADLFVTHASTYYVGMRDDIRELISIAAFYLFGTDLDLTASEYEQIKTLLIEQKKQVMLYADERLDTLLISHASPLVLTISGDISRAINAYERIDFVIPLEGTFIDIDSFVIAASCTHPDDVYLFLNYLYTPSVLSYYAQLFRLSLSLSTINTYAKIPLLAYPTAELFSRLQFFATVIPQSFIDDILIALKSA